MTDVIRRLFARVLDFFKQNRPLVVILLAAALAEAAFFALLLRRFGSGYEGFILGWGDPKDYLTLALNLIKYKAYVWSVDPWYLDVFRLPLNPFFIAIAYKMLGHFWAVIILQQILFALPTLIVIWLIFVFLFDKRTAFWATLFAALSPPRIAMVNQFSAESIFLLVFFLFILFVLKFIKKAEGGDCGVKAFEYIALAGLFLGLGVLARGFVLTLVTVMAFYLLYLKARRILSWRQAVISAVLFAGAAYAVILPWMIRNYYHFGAFKVSSTFEYGVYSRHLKRIYEYQLKYAGKDGKDLWAAPVQRRFDEFKEDNNLGFVSDLEMMLKMWSFEYSDYERAKSFEVIKDNLGTYAHVWSRRIPGWLLDNDLGTEVAFTRNYIYPEIGIEPYQALWFGRFVFLGIYLVIAAGFLRRPSLFLQRTNTMIFLLLIYGIFIVSGALVYTPRHKLPIDFLTYGLLFFVIFQYFSEKKKIAPPNH